MADIFISYARADRPRIEKLSAALETEGWSVWWDRSLVGGREFAAEIERELNAAKIVIVAWSKDGAASPWVRDEAARGQKQNKLIPIRVDKTDPPMGFGQYHVIDLSNWNGKPASAEYQEVSGAVRVWLSGEKASEKPAPLKTEKFEKKRLMLIAAFIAILLLSALSWRFITQSYLPKNTLVAAGENATVAVLPFITEENNVEDTYLGEGIAGDVIDKISTVDKLKVISSNSSFKFVEDNENFSEIAATLGATHIVWGKLQQHSDKLRIQVRLISPSNGANLWLDDYSVKSSETTRISTLIAEAVARAITGNDVKINQEEKSEINVVAYDLYLRGKYARHVFNFNEENGTVALLEQAVALEPDWLDALNALALSYQSMATFEARDNNHREELLAKRARTLKHALEVDPDNALSLAMLATEEFNAQDWIKTRELLERAMKSDPNDLDIRNWVAILVQLSGNLRGALALFEQNLALDPLDSSSHSKIAYISHQLGDYTRAVKHAELALKYGEVGMRGAHVGSYSLAAMGKTKEAVEFYDQIEKDAHNVGLRDENQGEKEADPLRLLLQNYDIPSARKAWLDHVRNDHMISDENFALGLSNLIRQLGEHEMADNILMLHAKAKGGRLSPYDMRYYLSPGPSKFRQTEEFKELMRNMNLPDYWRQYGWPEVCRPISSIDFTCY